MISNRSSEQLTVMVRQEAIGWDMRSSDWNEAIVNGMAGWEWT